MSTIQTIDNELPSTARPKINQNFSNLNADKMEKSANLSDVANPATARNNIGAAAASHAHAQSDITGLVAALAAKAASGANTDIVSLSPTGDLVLNPSTLKVLLHAGLLVFRSNAIEDHATNGLSQIAVNYNGYNNGHTQFRDFTLYDGKGNEIARFEGAKKTLRFTGAAAPAVSEAGTGTIYFDSTSNKFKVSENGGSYANLGGGGPVASYAVTKTDVVSTAAETTTISFTVPANTWADGDVIEIIGLAKVRNDDGGAGNGFVVKLKAGSGSVTIINGGSTITSEKLWMFKLYLMRVGSACYGGSTNGNYPLDVIINNIPNAENAGLLSVNPTYTSDVTVTVTIDLGTSSANCYFKLQAVRAIKIAEQ